MYTFLEALEGEFFHIGLSESKRPGVAVVTPHYSQPSFQTHLSDTSMGNLCENTPKTKGFITAIYVYTEGSPRRPFVLSNLSFIYTRLIQCPVYTKYAFTVSIEGSTACRFDFR